MARRGNIVEDLGIDNELPLNPLVFILEAGTHPNYAGPLLVFAPDGNPIPGNRQPIPGNRQPIHNKKGVYHKLKISTAGKIKLGPRRKNIEAHNVHTPDCSSIPITPTIPQDPLAQIVASSSTNLDRMKIHSLTSTPQTTAIPHPL